MNWKLGHYHSGGHYHLHSTEEDTEFEPEVLQLVSEVTWIERILDHHQHCWPTQRYSSLPLGVGERCLPSWGRGWSREDLVKRLWVFPFPWETVFDSLRPEGCSTGLKVVWGKVAQNIQATLGRVHRVSPKFCM